MNTIENLTAKLAHLKPRVIMANALKPGCAHNKPGALRVVAKRCAWHVIMARQIIGLAARSWRI
ncbi:MAG: hypothetical protein COB04_08420 [Gammaproteobacteria bacterium]|nr:MAG: hypothetical protein COB04_08420 [Gammaproteobacteria bacterium]